MARPDHYVFGGRRKKDEALHDAFKRSWAPFLKRQHEVEKLRRLEEGRGGGDGGESETLMMSGALPDVEERVQMLRKKDSVGETMGIRDMLGTAGYGSTVLDDEWTVSTVPRDSKATVATILGKPIYLPAKSRYLPALSDESDEEFTLPWTKLDIALVMIAVVASVVCIGLFAMTQYDEYKKHGCFWILKAVGKGCRARKGAGRSG